MKKLLPVVLLAGVSAAQAASVLDTAATTAISTGFTDMKDTALQIVGLSWPFLIGIMAVMFAPKVVKRLANKA